MLWLDKQWSPIVVKICLPPCKNSYHSLQYQCPANISTQKGILMSEVSQFWFWQMFNLSKSFIWSCLCKYFFLFVTFRKSLNYCVQVQTMLRDFGCMSLSISLTCRLQCNFKWWRNTQMNCGFCPLLNLSGLYSLTLWPYEIIQLYYKKRAFSLAMNTCHFRLWIECKNCMIQHSL